MEDEEQFRSSQNDSYTNWRNNVKSNKSNGYMMNLFGNERVVVRFSDKFDGSHNHKYVKENKNIADRIKDDKSTANSNVPTDKPEINDTEKNIPEKDIQSETTDNDKHEINNLEINNLSDDDLKD